MISIKQKVWDELAAQKVRMRALDFDAACRRMLGESPEGVVHEKAHIQQKIDDTTSMLVMIFDAKYAK